MTDIIVTGITTSHSFDQNTSHTDTVERVITFEFMDMTASTTITQGVWLDKKFIVNLNDQWQLSSNVANPDSDLYDGVYESFSNLGQSSTGAIMYIDIEGHSEFTLYIRSYGESSHDYVMVGQLDAELTNGSAYSNTSLVKAHTKGTPVRSTDINSYTKVTYENIDEGNMRDFEMQQDEADLNILAIHAYLTDTPQHPDIKCTMCQDVISDADLILTGHYHRAFEWSDGQNLDIFNPGSMLRVEQTDYNKNHVPQYGILDIGLDASGNITWDYNFHQFKIALPSTVVFDYNAKYKAKHASITLDGFKNSISNTMSAVQPSMTIDKIINDICTAGNVEASLQQLALDTYHNTLQTIPDKFEVQQGYIEAQQSKKIAKVILENFQAHEHTEVEFDDGLNIIVGESNNGKTSILRGIMWVIDNQPLGTDFIMAGKDNCFVRIIYDDQTFIERGRTLKDTGYYKVGFIDENGNLTHQMYRGFTNAVPVEVANVHQMPKVNITKDIETHLNVLSQLDGPFLLTESPLVKASAIGRITGTHVVDDAIKESNKTIQGNNKLVKNYQKELEEKENELMHIKIGVEMKC